MTTGSTLFNDITISNRIKINLIGEQWADKDFEIPVDLTAWEDLIPKMDIWINVLAEEIHHVAAIIPTLKWCGGNLGVRIAFQPKDISKLFNDYREAFFAARSTENADSEATRGINLYPKDLCAFLERKLATYFSIKSYVLDPQKFEDSSPQATPFELECFTDNPLKGIIRVDMIDAQRGFSDPDTADEGERVRNKLSAQMRSYYDKHLDPEKMPSPEDLKFLEATENARSVFDENLAEKFKPAIRELESLGYPGVTDPKITITTKVSASDTLKHDSAVQYALSKTDETLRLPEKYSGLGYQNLISMVFNLMRFRDDWMRGDKAKQTENTLETAIEPLHLVIVEEPEVHLHMQVQQVFIRKAYSVLRNNKFLDENANFSTQLIISTHSSHIARETNFSDLRYFKRLPETPESGVATAAVINLTDVFGKDNQTDKFVTRYLQTTHCDLFFADAAILVEGSAESMLLPHFIRSKYAELNQRYISILPINGRHSHRLGPLIETLCLPVLVITDLDTVVKNGSRKAVRPIRDQGQISGNYAITNWLIGESELEKLLAIPKEAKVVTQKTLCQCLIRIAYQTPVEVEFNGSECEALSRMFEDCLIYTNFDFFKAMDTDDAGGLVKKINEAINTATSFEKLHEEIYNMLRDGNSTRKAEFALDVIYAIDPEAITVPAYIAEGLEWLQTLLRPEE